MTSAYLAIYFLRQTPLPEKQLRIFLSYLPQEPLKEYLYNADISHFFILISLISLTNFCMELIL